LWIHHTHSTLAENAKKMTTGIVKVGEYKRPLRLLVRLEANGLYRVQLWLPIGSLNGGRNALLNERELPHQ